MNKSFSNKKGSYIIGMVYIEGRETGLQWAECMVPWFTLLCKDWMEYIVICINIYTNVYCQLCHHTGPINFVLSEPTCSLMFTTYCANTVLAARCVHYCCF